MPTYAGGKEEHLYLVPIINNLFLQNPYTPFILKHDCPFGRTPVGVIIPRSIIPLRQPLPGTTRGLKFSDDWTAWDIPQIKTVSSKNWEAYNLGVRSSYVTRFHLKQALKTEHGTRRLLKYTWWFLLVRLAKVKLLTSFGVNTFAENLGCGQSETRTGW